MQVKPRTSILTLLFFLGFGSVSQAMELHSSAFAEGDAIPARYTCDGANVSPSLQWSALPSGTRALALLVDDPDAPDPRHPRTIWTHWLVYNIPPQTLHLPEGIRQWPEGTVQGNNDWQRNGYGGPCPPVGRHRYRFSLYALDEALPVQRGMSRSGLLQVMQGHILEHTTLTGLYQRP